MLGLLSAVFGEFFVRRLEIAADLIAVSSMIAVTLLLYGIFKPVNRGLSLLAASFNLVGLTFGALRWNPRGVEVYRARDTPLGPEAWSPDGQRVAYRFPMARDSSVRGRPIPGIADGIPRLRRRPRSTPIHTLEAIHIATENGARFLQEKDRIGTLAPGKQADLVVVRGDPSSSKHNATCLE